MTCYVCNAVCNAQAPSRLGLIDKRCSTAWCWKLGNKQALYVYVRQCDECRVSSSLGQLQCRCGCEAHGCGSPGRFPHIVCLRREQRWSLGHADGQMPSWRIHSRRLLELEALARYSGRCLACLSLVTLCQITRACCYCMSVGWLCWLYDKALMACLY